MYVCRTQLDFVLYDNIYMYLLPPIWRASFLIFTKYQITHTQKYIQKINTFKDINMSYYMIDIFSNSNMQLHYGLTALITCLYAYIMYLYTAMR